MLLRAIDCKPKQNITTWFLTCNLYYHNQALFKIRKLCLGRQFMIWVSNKDKRIDEFESHRKENTAKIFFGWMFTSRQNSYSQTVLGRVGLDHECEAHAGTFSPRGQTNTKKLRLSFRSLPKLRTILNIVKFRGAYILERSLFQTTKGISAHYYWEKQRS